ncbi:HAD family hydrolase [Helicobacter burdigaliensis]|uniref:HAD family hydrolase n=1 Tax=Helicobacter burdigaliensis TaxID=2315334 RepID=UPI000EF74190|nr:HAD-IA family hydrolase [Helicobacter burdigaliensis]
MKNRIILFDLDGTLIDSTQAVYESFCHSFKALGEKEPTFDAVSSQIGHTLEDMFKTLGVQEKNLKQHIDIYKEHYRQICNAKTQLLTNAKEAILKAHTFATLGVVTTKTGKYSKLLLEHFGVLEKFACVIGREDVIHAKPDKEPILKALELINIPLAKQQIFMIGDTPLDILAASSAGVNSIGVLSGYASKELLEKYTNSLAKDALEAVCMIEKDL